MSNSPTIRPSLLASTLLLTVPASLAASEPGGKAFLPELPDVYYFSTAEDLDPTVQEASEKEIILAVYQEAEDRLRRSGHEITFELSNFRTIYRSEFDDTLLLDTMTLPIGKTLATTTLSMRSSGESHRRVHFKVEWDRKDQGLSPESEKGFATVTLGDVFRSKPPGSELSRTVAVTTYQVLIRYDHEERLYRANIDWVPTASDPRHVIFKIQDWVIPHIQQVITETDEITSASNMLELRDLHPVVEGDLTTTSTIDPGHLNTGTCVSNTWEMVRGKISTPVNFREHNDGFHGGSYQLRGDCTCTSNCLASCTPVVVEQKCSDTGDVTGLTCHRPQLEVGMDGAQAPNQANCLGGLGCFIESCGLCRCDGLSISAKQGTVGFSFTLTSGTSIWSATLNDNALCLCEEETAPDQDPFPCFFDVLHTEDAPSIQPESISL